MLNPSAYADPSGVNTEADLIPAPVNPDCLVSVENFPLMHTNDMITKICEVFGKVNRVEMEKDPNNGRFTGTVTV